MRRANLVVAHRVRSGDDFAPRYQRKLRGFDRALRKNFESRSGQRIGDYLEFGVFYGATLGQAFTTMNDIGFPVMRFFGFDSFQGMPQESRVEAGGWLPGQYKAKPHVVRKYLKARGVDLSRVELIEGWYSESLNKKTARRLDLKQAGIIMLDCDLYSSTLEALKFCLPLIQTEVIVMLDDWYTKGVEPADNANMLQQRAFREFLDSANCFDVKRVGRYSRRSAIFRLSRQS